MPMRFRLDGLTQLREELRQLPITLRREAQNLVQAEANAAAVELRRVYLEHRYSGNLAKGVQVVTENKGSFGVVYMVKSAAPHAWLFDNGSQARHWVSGKSTGEMWGKTPNPPMHTFVRTMIGARKKMWKSLAQLLERVGLKVSGYAAA